MVEFHHIKKRFGKLNVLTDLNLTLEKGSVTAVVGHNGSGKTTLIKILLGLTRPDAGEIYFDGLPLDGDASYRHDIGYMPQSPRFPENLTGNEILDLVADLRGNPVTRQDTLMESLGLGKDMSRPFRTLSGGTRQKISAVIAFHFGPRLLILDEPTAGLDPLSSSRLKDHIKLVKARGTSILLTSHIMSEVEELADRIVYLLDGQIRFEGEPRSLVEQTGQEQMERAIAHLMSKEDES